MSASAEIKLSPAARDITPIAPGHFVAGRFSGKTLLVTGGARGIGKATAIRAAREGANVVIADMLEDKGDETLNEIVQAGGRAIFVRTDVRSNDDCKRMVDEAVAAFGGIDLVLNAAGVMDGVHPGDDVDVETQRSLIFDKIHEAGDEYWDTVMDINITGMFKSMRHELRQLLRQNRGGAIVNIGSIAGLIGLAGNPAYVASKHAVTGLTRNAAIDYAPYGIRVNSVNMAGTETPMTDSAFKKVMAVMQEQSTNAAGQPPVPDTSFAKSMSLLMMCDSNKRMPMATPWEQAAIILFLLSDDASNMTGATLATDGGWTCY